jgi:hypothetical protein
VTHTKKMSNSSKQHKTATQTGHETDTKQPPSLGMTLQASQRGQAGVRQRVCTYM